MELVRIHVSPLGRGYLAESRVPKIIAMGATAQEAAENARRQAVQMLCPDEQGNRGTLLVRLSEPGRESIAMQCLLSAFSLRNTPPGGGLKLAVRE